MTDINNVTIIGRLTRDVEKKESVCVFSIAFNTYSKNGDEVNYIDVKAFGKLSEVCAEFLSKGVAVVVAGKIRQERWEGQNGKNSRILIYADSVQFFNTKKSDIKPQEAQDSKSKYADEDVPF
jgi:single-strand DNA-binding protein